MRGRASNTPSPTEGTQPYATTLVLLRRVGAVIPGVLVDMALTLDYRGPLLEGGTPAEGELDNLSLAIIEGLCDHWEALEPGIVQLYVRS